MPLPFILAGVALAAGAMGVKKGIEGAVKLKEANSKVNEAKKRHDFNVRKFGSQNRITASAMDELGKKELETLESFKRFNDLIEKIQNRPEFKMINIAGEPVTTYDPEELYTVSIGAGVLLGSLGGAAIGSAGGFAAAGATTSAVMALGTASTGTAIASLSGVAATNATLAALGGGSLAAGGGGVALGTTVLGASTLGIGLLVGGLIFDQVGSNLSDKADEAYHQMEKAQDSIDKICFYLAELKVTCDRFIHVFMAVSCVYKRYLNMLDALININEISDWNKFSDKEKLAVQNTVLLVGFLYRMCKVKLVKQSKNKEGINTINMDEINRTLVTVKRGVGRMEGRLIQDAYINM